MMCQASIVAPPPASVRAPTLGLHPKPHSQFFAGRLWFPTFRLELVSMSMVLRLTMWRWCKVRWSLAPRIPEKQRYATRGKWAFRITICQPPLGRPSRPNTVFEHENTARALPVSAGVFVGASPLSRRQYPCGKPSEVTPRPRTPRRARRADSSTPTGSIRAKNQGRGADGDGAASRRRDGGRRKRGDPLSRAKAELNHAALPVVVGMQVGRDCWRSRGLSIDPWDASGAPARGGGELRRVAQDRRVELRQRASPGAGSGGCTSQRAGDDRPSPPTLRRDASSGVRAPRRQAAPAAQQAPGGRRGGRGAQAGGRQAHPPRHHRARGYPALASSGLISGPLPRKRREWGVEHRRLDSCPCVSRLIPSVPLAGGLVPSRCTRTRSTSWTRHMRGTATTKTGAAREWPTSISR